MISRRRFIQQTGATILGAGLLPSLLRDQVWAAAHAGTAAGFEKRVLVLIIQRGAMDGLSMVAPLADRHYLEARPNLAIRAQGEGAALRLDGNFGLHPAFSALKPFWDDSTLAFIHQVGQDNPTRSHFDAQDYLESGTPGQKSTSDGFLNRVLRSNPAPLGDPPLRGVAMQPSMPRILQGKYPALSMNSLKDFQIKVSASQKGGVQGFEAMYRSAADQVLRGAGNEAFRSLRAVATLRKDSKERAESYPKSGIGTRLHEIATLIQADLGMQVAVTDMGGWDTHVNQGAAKGQLADRFKELSEALAAFRSDLGQRFEQVCVVTVTEFGRTVKEDGNRGTDHGHGSVMSLMGSQVRGGKVHGKWKELSPANLFEGRDLPVTTDLRDVFSEILKKHLGLIDIDAAFPEHRIDPARFLDLIRT